MPEHGFERMGDVLRRLGVTGLTGGDPLVADRPDPLVCAHCRGAGLLRRDVPATDPMFGQLIECPCGIVQSRRSSRIWSMSQVPPSMRDYSLDSYLALTGDTATVGLLRRVWDETDRWPLLIGPVGLGKTGLAVSLLNETLASGGQGLYVVTPTFLSRIRATYTRTRDGEVDELDVLASVIETPLLVLDDLGKVALSEWGQEKLFTLINERYLAERRTIVTSNLPINSEEPRSPTLEGHLWPATWDRIRGMADVFTLDGESLR